MAEELFKHAYQRHKKTLKARHDAIEQYKKEVAAARVFSDAGAGDTLDPSPSASGALLALKSSRSAKESLANLRQIDEAASEEKESDVSEEDNYSSVTGDEGQSPYRESTFKKTQGESRKGQSGRIEVGELGYRKRQSSDRNMMRRVFFGEEDPEETMKRVRREVREEVEQTQRKFNDAVL